LSSTGSLNILVSNLALDDERLLVIAALHGRHHVRRQGQAPALQPLLQPRLRILERRRIGQTLELYGEHEVDDSFCRGRAAVKQYGADQCFDGIGQNRGPLRSARAQLAGTEQEMRVDAEALTDRRERRFLDERGAGSAQVALGVLAAQLEEPTCDCERQEGVAKVLEPLVVGSRSAAVSQRQVEKTLVLERVTQLRLGPEAARAHRVISTCLS